MSEDTGNERVIAGRYRLLTELGRGGMGIVWRARDELLAREVAVKEVKAPGGLDERDVQRLYSRLEREAWAAARISHRSVVTVYDVATEDGRPWIVMELVRGLSFADVLDAEGPLEPARVARVGAAVLGALRAAHEAGVLHRDVKPGNVLIGNDGRVVLTDFGIARIEGGSAITMTGEVIGSPEYLAPERALGRTPGPASDLWSLGVTLYAAVEGYSPFRQDTPLSTLRAVVDEELPAPVRAGPLAPVIAGLLRKDPAERLPAAEAEHQLRLVAAGGTPRTATYVVPPVPYTPTVHTPQPPPTPPRPHTQGLQSAGAATTSTGAGSGSERPRRAGLVLAMGMLLLALGAGGLAWALVNMNDDPGSSTGGNGDSGGDTGGDTGGDSGSAGGTSSSSDDKGTETSSSPPKSTPPPSITVHITAEAVRDHYTGSCPPPESAAPSFSGTITVGRTPAEVTYRWVTYSGQGGTDWKTVSYPAGSAKQKQVSHTIALYKEGQTYKDSVVLEVKSPQAVKSNAISFTTICETNSPSPTYTTN